MGSLVSINEVVGTLIPEGEVFVSMLAPVNSISILRGSSKTLELAVTDEKENAVDLTGATVYFSVKKTKFDPYPIIQKTSLDLAQVAISDPPRLGKAQIFLVPEDTKSLAEGAYPFDVWVILSSGARVVPIPPSILEIEIPITKLL